MRHTTRVFAVVAGLNQTPVQTIALTAVDPYTVTFNTIVDGKITGTGKRIVANDGKTMTIETKGTNAQGQPTSTMLRAVTVGAGNGLVDVSGTGSHE